MRARPLSSRPSIRRAAAPILALAVAALSTIAKPANALAGEAPANGPDAGKATVSHASREPSGGLMPRLDEFLSTIAALRVASPEAAAGLRHDFSAYQERDPKTLMQAGFEYAIPALTPGTPEHSSSSGSDQPPARPVHEILGTRKVAEEDLPEIFRRMLAPTKEDGVHFDMFVKEAYLALVKQALFRNPDGSVDKRAVSESVQRDKGAYAIVAAELESMRIDGRGKRLASAITGMAAYAERKGLAFAPVRLRTALVHMQTCVGAKPGSDPALYAGSCGQMMIWMGEPGRTETLEVQFYSPQTGGEGPRYAIAPWDREYAGQAYGTTFTDVQATANDALWQRHFRLYAEIASAKEATLNASYSAELLRLETAVGRTMKLLLCYAKGTECDGRKASLGDVRAAVQESRQIKSSLETAASPAFRNREGFADTMKGFDQVLARAKLAGI